MVFLQVESFPRKFLSFLFLLLSLNFFIIFLFFPIVEVRAFTQQMVLNPWVHSFLNFQVFSTAATVSNLKLVAIFVNIVSCHYLLFLLGSEVDKLTLMSSVKFDVDKFNGK